MDVVLGRFHAQLEVPQTRKFAWPIIVLPELFTTSRHLVMLAGHLVTLGWELYLFDIHSSPLSGEKKPLLETTFRIILDDITTALSNINSDVIAIGHGLGGLFALKLAEASRVRAAVALAPLIPGFRSPLFVRKRWTFWRETAGLPARSKLLELVSEAEPFQREALIKTLLAADTSAAMDVARDAVNFAVDSNPRLVIVGCADSFAPCRETERFAAKIGAHFEGLPGRGHWLIGGRALERVIGHLQRFLVRALGEELLLLYDEAHRGDLDEKTGR